MLAALGCDGTQVPAETAAEPAFSITGTVRLGSLEAAPAASQEVGVLWLNLLNDNQTVFVEVTEADAIGESLPAPFDVSIVAPPSDRMLGTTLISYSEGGASEQPVDRNRVAFGFVVVAEEGTFATLPDKAMMTEFINSSDAEPGPLLSRFTYVSPYAVRYVEGASEEGLTIRDINGVESVLKDMTLFDISAWARGVDNSVCRDRRLGEGWQAPEVQSCIAGKSAELAEADARQQACLDACAAEPAGEGDDGSCQTNCYFTENGRQAIENNCLLEWSDAQAAETEAACGPQPDFAASDFRNSPMLAEGDVLNLTLGEGDVRQALTHGGFIFLF